MGKMFFTVWEVAGDMTQGDPLQEGAVNIGSDSTQSTDIAEDNRKRKRVRVFVDTDAFVTWGGAPQVAKNDGTAGRPINAECPEYFDIQSGHVLAVIERVSS